MIKWFLFIPAFVGFGLTYCCLAGNVKAGMNEAANCRKAYAINLLSKEIKVSFAGLIYMSKDTLPIPISPVEQVKAVKANDPFVLKRLYQDNYYKIENYVLNNSGNEDEAKDIYQEAFLAVWRNIQLDKFHPENETALAGYLFQVSKNKWLDHLRSSYRKKVVPMDHTKVTLIDEDTPPTDDTEQILAIKNNFKSLGENCKELLKKFYYQKQSLREIASHFEWTEATARNNKYRCIQRLRDMFKNEKK